MIMVDKRQIYLAENVQNTLTYKQNTYFSKKTIRYRNTKAIRSKQIYGGGGNSGNLGGSRFTLFSRLSVLLCLMQIAIIPGVGLKPTPPPNNYYLIYMQECFIRFKTGAQSIVKEFSMWMCIS